MIVYLIVCYIVTKIIIAWDQRNLRKSGIYSSSKNKLLIFLTTSIINGSKVQSVVCIIHASQLQLWHGISVLLNDITGLVTVRNFINVLLDVCNFKDLDIYTSDFKQVISQKLKDYLQKNCLQKSVKLRLYWISYHCIYFF